MMERFRDAFIEEAADLLSTLEDSLLALEAVPDNEELINAVFRTIHTIKGSAAMFGFERISDFAHGIETLLEHLRDGDVTATPPLIGSVLACRDRIREMLAESEEQDGDKDLHIHLIDELEKSIRIQLEEKAASETSGESEMRERKSGAHAAVPEAGRSGATQKVPAGGLRNECTYRIRFRPKADIFRNGTNPLAILQELSAMGEFTCIPFHHVPPLSELVPESCYFHWDILLSTRSSVSEVEDVFLFARELAEVRIDLVEELSDLAEDPVYKRLGDILVQRGSVSPGDIERSVQKQRRLGELLVEEGVPSEEVTSALQEQQHLRRMREKYRKDISSSSVRVSSEKLDTLVDLVGELVTVQARLSSTAAQIEDVQLAAIAEQVERLTAELRDSAMSVRMLPMMTTFNKFRRVIRDLSQELGKEVDFLAEGGETELDKTVIEKLSDPLVHIIRNSVDHGLEFPEERLSAGKSERGCISIRATHSGAYVLISVQDDGRGIDPEKIRETAIRRGLISPDAQLDEREILQLIFAPGFSTAKEVTTVSGRGVGMDVVKKSIDNLSGSVSINSTPGKGTEIVLKLPLTLAIIEGLLVEIAGDSFVIPLAAVEECVEFREGNRDGGRRLVNNRGEMLPYLVLQDLFQLSGEFPEIRQLVVVNSGAGKVGLMVDRVIGNYQTVIKNLGKIYRKIEGISGATIMGDGGIALIIDVQKVAALGRQEEMRFVRGR